MRGTVSPQTLAFIIGHPRSWPGARRQRTTGARRFRAAIFGTERFGRSAKSTATGGSSGPARERHQVAHNSVPRRRLRYQRFISRGVETTTSPSRAGRNAGAARRRGPRRRAVRRESVSQERGEADRGQPEKHDPSRRECRPCLFSFGRLWPDVVGAAWLLQAAESSGRQDCESFETLVESWLATEGRQTS